MIKVTVNNIQEIRKRLDAMSDEAKEKAVKAVFDRIQKRQRKYWWRAWFSYHFGLISRIKKG